MPADPVGAAVGESLAGLCARSRPAFAALGELGAPLLGVLAAVERAGRGGDVALLADPGFALEVLTAAGLGTDPAMVGRVLDFLRSQINAPTFTSTAGFGGRRGVTVAEAVESYLAGALSLLAEGTQHGYGCWARRLVEAHGDDVPADVTAGDLKDLIARWVTEVRSHDPHARREGASVENAAVAAFRHLWGYFCDKGWATENIAKAMRKPPPDDPLRRPWRPEEAAVIRHLARGLGRTDGLLNEVTISVAERVGLRRTELRRLRNCDVDLVRAEMRVWGKGNKIRVMPIPPVLGELLERYMESRRPDDVTPEDWARSEQQFLRHRPHSGYGAGKPVGQRRIDRLFASLREAAPDIFVNGDLCLHSYRHALGTYVDGRYGRAVTREVLGHKGRKSPTDHYVHVAPETVRAALCAYEAHLLAADPTTHREPGDDQASGPEAASMEVTP